MLELLLPKPKVTGTHVVVARRLDVKPIFSLFRTPIMDYKNPDIAEEEILNLLNLGSYKLHIQ